ncbi:hypothetical protein CCACVL1_26246 [Corchorus capsularis]|uniref:Uncharacterized protein n=1 Tax=Corchorus capsularis TaxID=210143 RepID=A0A1R3GFF7_COCAP|nr:hypothetical protein CCACVL1_26246 [Corchorus capsularis]
MAHESSSSNLWGTTTTHHMKND